MSFPNVETTITVEKYFEAAEGNIWYNIFSNGEVFIHDSVTCDFTMTISPENSKQLYEALKVIYG